jgi:hypothetical protein
MKVKKILVYLSLIILFFAASLFGTILYLYYHPSTLKPFIEASISRSTGSAFTIKELSYSIKPLRIRAGGATWPSSGSSRTHGRSLFGRSIRK